MAYRELGMVELREIVRRWLGGEGIRAIARATGMDRKTIAEYLRPRWTPKTSQSWTPEIVMGPPAHPRSM